ncbi:histidine kinase [Streptomyces sp. Ru87]|uniref:histidine kinase n=1 Tax=Streptomyces sp. Ru87 TaxID=2044307 RepID=UPI00211D9D17|nr:histidine kinase [Streptomyces sp. Ru87]
MRAYWRRHGGGWRSRSRIGQVDLYTRMSLYSLAWFAVLYAVFLLAAGLEQGTGHRIGAGALAVLSLFQGVSCTRLLRMGIEQYLGRAAVPRRELLTGVFLATAATVGVVALTVTGGLSDMPEAVGLLSTATILVIGPCCLLAPLRTTTAVQAGTAAAVVAALAVAGADRRLLLVTAVALPFTYLWVTVTVRCSLWVLAVMWELEEARGVQPRLAVAEERLRFARDMHDVMGRNLAVIALKSELAVQLSRRGSAAAVDQMVEVQRIARDSQREVREVVRGYRQADLHTELIGAAGVLRAAGTECHIEDRYAGELPAEVQSALGWVVREGTTNVLRHADAARCSVRVRIRPGRRPGNGNGNRTANGKGNGAANGKGNGATGGNGPGDGGRGGRTAVLVMENDGVPDAPAGGGTDSGTGGGLGEGSGLAGLRQRLAGLGGRVDARRLPGGEFRLTAEIPVDAQGPQPAEEASGEGAAGLPDEPSGGAVRQAERVGRREQAEQADGEEQTERVDGEEQTEPVDRVEQAEQAERERRTGRAERVRRGERAEPKHRVTEPAPERWGRRERRPAGAPGRQWRGAAQ